jgi:hypothetical protein
MGCAPVVIEGDKMTATAESMPGGGGPGFIDYWERVR